MGVKNWGFIKWTVDRPAILDPPVLAIDAPNYLIRRVRTIEHRGTSFADRISTTYFSIVLQFILKSLQHNILPVFVFDGPPERLKRPPNPGLVQQAGELYRQFSKSGDLYDLMLVQSLNASPSLRWYFSTYHIRDLCSAVGVPAITSPTEAEMAAAVLCRDGVAGSCLSNDADALLFGSPHVTRSIRFTRDELEYATLDSLMHSLDLSLEQLRDLAILCGCDFSPGIKGIGPSRGTVLLQRFGDLRGVLKYLGVLPTERDSLIRARETFDEAEKISVEHDFRFQSPLPSRLSKMLIVVFGEERAETLVRAILRASKNFGSYQTTLEMWS